MNEPKIIINGKELSNAQAATIRCAVENFAFDLKTNGLGDDEHGKEMARLYMRSIEAIRELMYE